MRAAVAQRVEGGDAGAEQRRGFDGIERVGHGGDRFPGRDHIFGVAAVVADAGPLFIDAVDEIAATALQAGEVVAAVPADADSLSFFPGGDAAGRLRR